MSTPFRIGLLISVVLHGLLIAGLVSLPFVPAASPSRSMGLSLNLVMQAPAPAAESGETGIVDNPVSAAAIPAANEAVLPMAQPATPPAPLPDRPAAVERAVLQASSPVVSPAPVIDTGHTRQSYLQQLSGRIQRHKFYPASGRRLGEQGRVLIALVIARDGQVSDARVKLSSGYRRLDEAALAAVLAAAPFSPLPPQFADEALLLSIPMDYTLR